MSHGGGRVGENRQKGADKEGGEGWSAAGRQRKRSQTRDLFGCATCLELAGDAIESDTPGWSCQTATSCPLYSHIAGV